MNDTRPDPDAPVSSPSGHRPIPLALVALLGVAAGVASLQLAAWGFSERDAGGNPIPGLILGFPCMVLVMVSAHLAPRFGPAWSGVAIAVVALGAGGLSLLL